MTQWLADRAHGSKLAGQFSTPDWIADLLCSRLTKVPRIAADLGIGKGALALALAKRFPETRLLGIDNFEVPRSSRSKMEHQGIRLRQADISLRNFSSSFLKRYGSMDAIVSNPPFITVSGQYGVKEMLHENHLIVGAERQRLDLIFLTHAMKMLKTGGEAAFILPVSAFSMSRTLLNLDTMVKRFGLAELIRLPNDLYEQAEVETAILIFRSGMSTNLHDHFIVREAKRDGTLEMIGTFSSSELVEYFAYREEIGTIPNSLGGIGGVIRRGRYSSNKLAYHGVNHFHTTSFQCYPNSQVRFDGINDDALCIDAPATEGDILIPRVGTRCLGRAAIVVGGRSHISDCVFRISTPVNKRRLVWEFLSSAAGRQWQLGLARGACAKFITQNELLGAPLPVSIN